MHNLANVVWFICGGWLSGLAWALVALICHMSIIGIPFGIACWRIARFACFPFGKELVDARLLGEKPLIGTFVGRLLWIVVAGFWLMLVEALVALLFLISCVVIVPIFLGAPLFALGHAKLAMVALDPLGKRVVSSDYAKALRAEHAKRTLDARLGRTPSLHGKAGSLDSNLRGTF